MGVNINSKLNEDIGGTNLNQPLTSLEVSNTGQTLFMIVVYHIEASQVQAVLKPHVKKNNINHQSLYPVMSH